MCIEEIKNVYVLTLTENLKAIDEFKCSVLLMDFKFA